LLGDEARGAARCKRGGVEEFLDVLETKEEQPEQGEQKYVQFASCVFCSWFDLSLIGRRSCEPPIFSCDKDLILL